MCFHPKNLEFFEKIGFNLRKSFDKTKTLYFTRISNLKFVRWQLEHPMCSQMITILIYKQKKFISSFDWLIYLKKILAFSYLKLFFLHLNDSSAKRTAEAEKKNHFFILVFNSCENRRIVSWLLLVEKPRWKSRKIK